MQEHAEELRSQPAARCPACGRELAPASEVCPHCGAKLERDARAAPDTERPTSTPEAERRGQRTL
jgi:uncharacterized OB-fold protein